MATKEKEKSGIKRTTIKLNKITANSGQTRGMGVLSQLLALGYGLFEKVAVDKDPIWPMLTSDKPEERKAAAALIRDHEPDIVNAAESQDQLGQLVDIRVVEEEGGTYDVIYGMTRALARAFNHAESAKEPDTIDAIVMERGGLKDIDLRFMGFAENNDRRPETIMDKAIFFKEIKDTFGLKPDDIGKKVGLTGQAIRDYLKMLHPKLEDKRMALHNGEMTIDAAKKLLTKRMGSEDGEEEEEGGGKAAGERARFPSVKKLEQLYDAKKKPDWIDQKEWEMVIVEGVRKWLALRLKKKYKPFSGEVLTKEEPKSDAASNGKVEKGKGPKLVVPKKKAIRLLNALGKPEAEGWTDKQLKEKLENIVNIAEEGTQLDDVALQTFLEKLIKGYAKGITITIK